MAKSKKKSRVHSESSSKQGGQTKSAAQSNKEIKTSENSVAARKLRRLWGLAGLGAIAVGASALYWTAQRSEPLPARGAIQSEIALQGFKPIAARNQCRGAPAFVTRLGFATPSLSTSERDILGLAVIDMPAGSPRRNAWRHASWKQSGALSAFAIDQIGNVYAVPAPRINLLDNPPEKQNRLYKVDAQTAEMSEVLQFPVPAPVNARNPFAGLGLSFDCNSNSLYLSSIAGSGQRQELGIIYRISLTGEAKITSSHQGIDALSVLSVDLDGQRRGLLLGSARVASVFGLRLDEQGDFISDAKPELLVNFQNFGPAGNERARKLDLTLESGTPILQLRGTHFAYNLAQPSAQARATHYRFRWSAENSKPGFVFQHWQ